MTVFDGVAGDSQNDMQEGAGDDNRREQVQHQTKRQCHSEAANLTCTGRLPEQEQYRTNQDRRQVRVTDGSPRTGKAFVYG